jgi:predicted transcriptional regulator
MTREEALKEALEIVKAQAGIRVMSAEELTGMVENVARGIMSLDDPGQSEEGGAQPPAVDPAKAIKESSATCLECGRAMKIITKKHLASHGLTPDEYRAKWGMKKGVALACKALTRERRKKMKDMKLWEKRGAAKPGA